MNGSKKKVKQIAIISGKGGTGKTTLTASFAVLAQKKVLADCDVDAADLHLLLQPKIKETNDFYGGEVAVIDLNKCTQCDECMEVCRYDAIHEYAIDRIACEGCGLCVHVCPVKAIRMEPALSGQWFVSETAYGPMVYAKLGVAQENSGKLVTVVRNRARELAVQNGFEYVLIDGPPGVGCPVIASITGVDLVLAVTEPTVAGVHDLRRVLDVAQQFQVPAVVVINKYDINADVANEVEAYCAENGVLKILRIPFDKVAVEALVQGKPVVTQSNGVLAKKIKDLWRATEAALRERSNQAGG